MECKTCDTAMQGTPMWTLLNCGSEFIVRRKIFGPNWKNMKPEKWVLRSVAATQKKKG